MFDGLAQRHNVEQRQDNTEATKPASFCAHGHTAWLAFDQRIPRKLNAKTFNTKDTGQRASLVGGGYEAGRICAAWPKLTSAG